MLDADSPINPERLASDPSMAHSRSNRRQFAVGALLGGLSAMSVSGATAYRMYTTNPYEPRLERTSFVLPAGHEDLAGLKIGFVADTHVGPHISPDDAARAIALLDAERPDLVLLGGDYISQSPRYAPDAAEVLGPFVRRAPLGGLAVLGNHDVAERGRDAAVTSALQVEGITVLRNESKSVDTGRGPLWIAGIDEAILARSDVPRTFSTVPRGAAVLALWHEPDYAELAAIFGAFAQLSGHSHGGQIVLPGIGPLVKPAGGSHYMQGLNRAGGMPIYTTRGVGVYQPPIRLNCPPEVTLVNLVSA